MIKHLWICILCFVLCGCTRTMDDIIQKEPSIKAEVIEVNASSFLMKDEEGTRYVIPKEVEYSDSYGGMVKGDIVVVYYDGTLLESWPVQMNHVYAITLLEPADRSINENS